MNSEFELDFGHNEVMTMKKNALRWPWLPKQAQAVYNLNDPRWGRSDEDSPRQAGDSGPQDNGQEPSDKPQQPQPSQSPQRPTTGQGGANQGPPDLDELWRDFNRKLGQVFGNKGAGGGSRGSGNGNFGGGG